MLKQRLITVAVLLPFIIWVFAFSPAWVVGAVFLAFVALGTFEISAMLSPRLRLLFEKGVTEVEQIPVPDWKSEKNFVILTVCMSLFLYVLSTMSHQDSGRGIITFGLLGAVLLGTFVGKTINHSLASIVSLVVSLVYGLFPWLAVWDLYQMGDQSRYVFLLLCIVWAGDSAAYFGGRFLGKNKLAPRFSPKKTREGAVAGLLGSMAFALLANYLFGGELGSNQQMVLVAIVGGVFGQLGDLVESCMKRFTGVKDSGTIFPGHGGFLDRVDGVLFAAPVVWLFVFINS